MGKDSIPWVVIVFCNCESIENVGLWVKMELWVRIELWKMACWR